MYSPFSSAKGPVTLLLLYHSGTSSAPCRPPFISPLKISQLAAASASVLYLYTQLYLRSVCVCVFMRLNCSDIGVTYGDEGGGGVGVEKVSDVSVGVYHIAPLDKPTISPAPSGSLSSCEPDA